VIYSFVNQHHQSTIMPRDWTRDDEWYYQSLLKIKRLAERIEKAESLEDSRPIEVDPPQHRNPRTQHNHTRNHVSTETYNGGAEGVTVTNRTSRNHLGYAAGASKTTKHSERSIPYRDSSSGYQQQAPSQPRSTPVYYTQSVRSSNVPTWQAPRSPRRSSNRSIISPPSESAMHIQSPLNPLTEDTLRRPATSAQSSTPFRSGQRTASQRPYWGEGLASIFDDAEDEEAAWRIYNDTSASQYRKKHIPNPNVSEPAPIPTPTADSARTTNIADTANTADTAKARKPARRTNETRPQRGRLLGANYGDDPRD
jgi:hypothetical protein